MDDKLIRESYGTFVKAPAGLDLLTYLDEQSSIDLDHALEEVDPVKAVGLLQKVNAYRTIRSYIERMSTIDNP